jgi:hypothetical protein
MIAASQTLPCTILGQRDVLDFTEGSSVSDNMARKPLSPRAGCSTDDFDRPGAAGNAARPRDYDVCI